MKKTFHPSVKKVPRDTPKEVDFSMKTSDTGKITDHRNAPNWQNYVLNMDITQVIYRFNAILIKIPMSFFMQI